VAERKPILRATGPYYKSLISIVGDRREEELIPVNPSNNLHAAQKHFNGLF